jgi:hypothetical protein
MMHWNARFWSSMASNDVAGNVHIQARPYGAPLQHEHRRRRGARGKFSSAQAPLYVIRVFISLSSIFVFDDVLVVSGRDGQVASQAQDAAQCGPAQPTPRRHGKPRALTEPCEHHAAWG